MNFTEVIILLVLSWVLFMATASIGYVYGKPWLDRHFQKKPAQPAVTSQAPASPTGVTV